MATYLPRNLKIEMLKRNIIVRGNATSFMSLVDRQVNNTLLYINI